MMKKEIGVVLVFCGQQSRRGSVHSPEQFVPARKMTHTVCFQALCVLACIAAATAWRLQAAGRSVRVPSALHVTTLDPYDTLRERLFSLYRDFGDCTQTAVRTLPPTVLCALTGPCATSFSTHSSATKEATLSSRFASRIPRASVLKKRKRRKGAKGRKCKESNNDFLVFSLPRLIRSNSGRVVLSHARTALDS